MGLDPIEQHVHRPGTVLRPGCGRIVHQCGDPAALQPRIGGRVLTLGQCIEQMPVEFGHTLGVEAAQHRQETRLVRRDLQVRHTEQERLIALIGTAVDQVGGLGVGAGHDDSGHAHDVELEPRGVQTLDLLIRGHQHLAALVPALLRAGTLVLDVVSGHAGFDETTNQVAHVRISAVAGVSVGDDEGTVVHRGGGGALLIGHLQPQILLVAIRGQQGAHQAGGLIGHLAQRVARQVRAGVLGDRALGRRRPTAQIDTFDTAALHRHGLARRVRPERGDRLVLAEQLTQAGVEGRGGLAGHGVVHTDRAALLDDLARGVQPGDARESGTVEVALGGGHFLLETGTGN